MTGKGLERDGGNTNESGCTAKLLISHDMPADPSRTSFESLIPSAPFLLYLGQVPSPLGRYNGYILLQMLFVQTIVGEYES